MEDLVLSGGQSLSENMQESEDFSEKNEYSGGSPWAILPNNTESQRKGNDKNNSSADADQCEVYFLKYILTDTRRPFQHLNSDQTLQVNVLNMKG